MNIPKTLKERLRSGSVIPFIGAGVSMSVRDRETHKRLFPSWREFLERAAERLEQEQKSPAAQLVLALLKIDKPNYLYAAEQARDGLGPVWFDLLREQFDYRREHIDAESLALAQSVWELGSRLIITTNYDRVLHWAGPKGDIDVWNIDDTVAQASALRDGFKHPTVWHLHGNISKPEELILTPDGYKTLYPAKGEVQSRYQAALEILRSLLRDHTFLFIGYSLDDAPFIGQLSDVHELFKGAPGPHYVLVREADRERIKSLNLPVEIVPFDAFDEPLLKLMRELGQVAHEKEAVSGIKTSSTENIISATRVADYGPQHTVFSVPFRQKGAQVIGREDALLAVHKQLTEGHRTSIGQTAAFRGLGGLGKTQLAVEYAYKYKDDYPNGVIWLNADQDIDAQLIELSERARWVAPESEHRYKLEIAQQRLRSYSDCLIIFDNLEERINIDNYLPEPQANPHILITSRSDRPGFDPIPIELLDENLSLELLIQETHRKPVGETEAGAALEIAKALGGLPLALELAGAYLRHREMLSFQQYREFLDQNPRQAFPKKIGSFTDHEADLYRTLKINEEVLKEDERLRDILDLLTWSGSSPMGISLMSALLDVKSSVELIGALNLGTSLRLLQKSPESESYAIHRLVGEVRREDIPIEERRDWVNITCQRLGDWFQDRREDFTQLLPYEAEIDHLRTWQEHAHKYVNEHTSRLMWLQAHPPFYRGRYQESKKWVDDALNSYNSREERDNELEAHLLNDLGSIFSFLGVHKSSLKYYLSALALRVELFGEKHSDTAITLTNIGIAYGNLGDNDKQLEFQERALSIIIDLFGEKHRHAAALFNFVGNAYGNLGDRDKQFEYQEKALLIRLELFGEKHPDTAESFDSVGIAYGNLGDRDKQFEYQEKALLIRLELFGEKHPHTAESFNSVGIAYGRLGNKQLALENLERGVALQRELLGAQHPAMIGPVYHLSNVLISLGQPLEAARLLDEFINKSPKDNPAYSSLKHLRHTISGFRAKSGRNRGPKSKKKHH